MSPVGKSIFLQEVNTLLARTIGVHCFLSFQAAPYGGQRKAWYHTSSYDLIEQLGEAKGERGKREGTVLSIINLLGRAPVSGATCSNRSTKRAVTEVLSGFHAPRRNPPV